MPLFEYKCSKCGHQFEKLKKSSEAATSPCPKCSAEASKKISAASFHLKGGGWAADGYGK